MIQLKQFMLHVFLQNTYYFSFSILQFTDPLFKNITFDFLLLLFIFLDFIIDPYSFSSVPNFSLHFLLLWLASQSMSSVTKILKGFEHRAFLL